MRNLETDHRGSIKTKALYENCMQAGFHRPILCRTRLHSQRRKDHLVMVFSPKWGKRQTVFDGFKPTANYTTSIGKKPITAILRLRWFLYPYPINTTWSSCNNANVPNLKNNFILHIKPLGLRPRKPAHVWDLVEELAFLEDIWKIYAKPQKFP